MRILSLFVLCVLAVVVAHAANEITTSCTLSAEKGYLSVSKSVQGLKTAMSGSEFEQKTTSVTGSMPLAVSLASPGMAFFRNLSTNGSVRVTTTFELAPGQFVQGPLGTNVVTVAPAAGLTNVLESIIISQ